VLFVLVGAVAALSAFAGLVFLRECYYSLSATVAAPAEPAPDGNLESMTSEQHDKPTPPAEPVRPEQVPSQQSAEDTDAAWGEYDRGERDDDRLLSDRPPHWADY
jgi:hypothetical protein